MHLILDAGSGLWSNPWRPALACHAKPDKEFQTACYIISNSSVSIYVEDILFKSGKRIKELKKKKPNVFEPVNLQGIHCGHETALFLAPSCHQRVQLTPGRQSGSSAGTRNSTVYSLKRCWRGVQSPSCLDAAAFNNVCWMYHSCPAQRKHTMPII